MISVSIENELEQLRAGDRLNYHGIQWQVKDYSTYQDPQGYETAEWLLRLAAGAEGTEYYLLREVDPQNPESIVHWYIAQEIRDPKIFLRDSSDNLVSHLWQSMQEEQTPYPELLLFGKNYYFESETQGSYDGEEENSSRITWDYWDKTHQWNLAFEAWPNGELHVYSTKVVKPTEFSDIEKGVIQNSRSIPRGQVLAASFFLLVGLFLLIFG